MSHAPHSLETLQRRAGLVLLTLIGTSFMALLGRVAYINAALRPQYVEVADQQHNAATTIPARRGTILDARGRPVALSRHMPDVFVDMTVVTEVPPVAEELSARLNVPAAELEQMMRRRPNSRFVVVARRVDEVTAEAVGRMKTAGVGLTDRQERTYPLARSLCHVLGWVGRDGSGLEGVELAFDKHLRGQDGRRAFVCDASRRGLYRDAEATEPPVDGGHVVLTIDAEIQRIAEDSLAHAISQYRAQSGVAVVMSPRTGEVLAMAGWPTFDPAEPVTARDKDLRRNKVLTDPIEPGSTFKPFIACGALEGGFVDTTEMLDCRMGSHYFGDRLVKDVKPYGMMDLRGILAKSSNIGMGLIATRMGNNVLYTTIRGFGFGERTGIDLPGEDPGVVYRLNKWTRYSTTSVAMGYEVLVTPLQLLTAFCSMVNDGVEVRPHVVRALLSPEGESVLEWSPPDRPGRSISQAVARRMAGDLLVSVVEQGGGHRAKVGPYRVLGKTGTAKLVPPGGRAYAAGEYQGLFMGAAPVSNPQIAVVVVIRRPDPKVGYYGGTVAAAPAGEILARSLAYLEVPPDAAPPTR